MNYISIITLGVSDLQKSTQFYKKLGFILQPGNAAISFFELEGTQLALYPKELLAKDARVSAHGDGFSGFTLAHNVKSKEEVDIIIKNAQTIGARVTDKPHDREWGGYSGYFADLDGYLWEIAWNPYFSFPSR